MADERPSLAALTAASALVREINRSRQWFNDPEQIEHYLRRVADELGFDAVKQGDR